MSKPKRGFESAHVRRVKAMVLWAIEKEDLDEKEIAEKTGLSARTVRDYARELYDAKELHVGGWSDMTGSKRHRIFRIGAGEDAPYPPSGPRGCQGEKVKKAGPPVSDQEIELEREWVPKRVCDHPVKIRRDWSVVAMFGEYQGARA